MSTGVLFVCADNNQVTIKHCSLRYHPYSCCCCHNCAVLTASRQICLEANEYCKIVSTSCCKNFRVSLGSCCAPPAYNSLIWSLMSEWVICCCISVPEWSSLLQWSHIPWHIPEFLDERWCPSKAQFPWFCMFPDFFLVVLPCSGEPSIHHAVPPYLLLFLLEGISRVLWLGVIIRPLL